MSVWGIKIKRITYFSFDVKMAQYSQKMFWIKHVTAKIINLVRMEIDWIIFQLKIDAVNPIQVFVHKSATIKMSPSRFHCGPLGYFLTFCCVYCVRLVYEFRIHIALRQCCSLFFQFINVLIASFKLSLDFTNQLPSDGFHWYFHYSVDVQTSK